jgi:biopolymer transport protein ExbD
MSKEKGLEAQIPEQQQQQPSNRSQIDGTIIIQVVDSVNNPPSLKINQEDVRWESLKNRLQDIFKLRAERVAFVRGDSRIDFQYVAEVIDIAHEAGVNRIGLLTNSMTQ